jgi:phosphatidylinositol dimannoside acyltransferase
MDGGVKWCDAAPRMVYARHAIPARGGITLAHLRAAARFDSGWWRRFAELGCVYGPEWWKRGSPPVIAAIIFAIARGRRNAVLRNQRQVRGGRGWLREHRDAYRVFAEFARSLTESLEQWGSRPPPLLREVPDLALFRVALAEGRGLVVPTAHFGGWDIGARFLSDLGRPVNLVVAPEPNPTTREFMHCLRTRFGFNIIYSGRSIFSALPVRQALYRNEVVGMQIDPWGASSGACEVDFCGRPARFQTGPFVIARVARAPLIPVFTVRTGHRRYQMRIAGRFDPRSAADVAAAFEATIRFYERLVREEPAQWLIFDDMWPAGGAEPETVIEVVPHRRRSAQR